MRAALVLSTVVWTAATAQTILPADQGHELFRRTDYTLLRCSAQPIPPALDFSFRFHAGYTVEVPFSQFHGPHHSWTVVVRVQPEVSGQPVYFTDRLDLPDVTNSRTTGDSGGGFLLGEGTYRVAFLLVDDQNRACRADWRIEALLSAGERNVKVAIPPGVIQPISRRIAGSADRPGDKPIVHLTVLLHAAPMTHQRSAVQASDVVALLGSLAALLDLAPEKAVRLVVFNLEQQKLLYRHESFTTNSMPAVQQAIFNLQLGKVDYQTLQNQTGYLDLLSTLVKEELHAAERSNVVVFLGPHSRLNGKLSADAVEKPSSAAPRFFYIEYERPLDLAPVGAAINGEDAEAEMQPGTRGKGRGLGLKRDDQLLSPADHVPTPTGEGRDSIEFLVGLLKGKKMTVRSPADFARAMEQIASTGRRK